MKINIHKYFIIGVIVAAISIIADQWSKHSAIEFFKDHPISSHKINEYFDIVLVWNKGISFGMFNSFDYSNIIFTILALIILVVLFIWLYRTSDWINSLALGLIAGGAIGNIVDRIRYEAVTDFIHLHYQEFSWPAFNIADSTIFLGVVFLFLDSILFEVRKIISGKNK